MENFTHTPNSNEFQLETLSVGHNSGYLKLLDGKCPNNTFWNDVSSKDFPASDRNRVSNKRTNINYSSIAESSCENRSKVHQNRNDGSHRWEYLFEESSSIELFCVKAAAQLPSNDPKKNSGLQDFTKRPLETDCSEENKYVFEGKVLFKNNISESLFLGPKKDQFLFLGTPCSSKTTNELLQSGDYGNSVLRKDNNMSADSLPQIDALTFLLRKQRFLFFEGSDLSSRVDKQFCGKNVDLCNEDCIFYLRKLEELLDDLKELHKQISELVYHADSLASGYSYSESVSMENSISDRIDFLLLKINQNSGHLPSVSNSFDFSKNKTFVFHNPTDVKPFVFGNDVPLNSKKVNPLMSCNKENSLDIYSKDVFSSFDCNTVKELDFKSDLITNGKFIFDFEWSDEPFNQKNLKSKSSFCEDLEMFCRNDNSFDNVQKDAFGPFYKSDKNKFTFDFEWSDEPFNQNNFKSESSTYVDLEIKIPEYVPFVLSSSKISTSSENVKLYICYEKDLVQINSDHFNHSNNCPVTTTMIKIFQKRKRFLSSISTKLKVGKYLGKVVFKNIFLS
ncbi:hypothetical protein ACFFRR_005873 [Megaselia abdita]